MSFKLMGHAFIGRDMQILSSVYARSKGTHQSAHPWSKALDQQDNFGRWIDCESCSFTADI